MLLRLKAIIPIMTIVALCATSLLSGCELASGLDLPHDYTLTVPSDRSKQVGLAKVVLTNDGRLFTQTAGSSDATVVKASINAAGKATGAQLTKVDAVDIWFEIFVGGEVTDHGLIELVLGDPDPKTARGQVMANGHSVDVAVAVSAPNGGSAPVGLPAAGPTEDYSACHEQRGGAAFCACLLARGADYLRDKTRMQFCVESRDKANAWLAGKSSEVECPQVPANPSVCHDYGQPTSNDCSPGYQCVWQYGKAGVCRRPCDAPNAHRTYTLDCRCADGFAPVTADVCKPDLITSCEPL